MRWGLVFLLLMLWQQTWAAERLQIIAKVPHTLRVDYQLCQRANKRGLCKQWSETKNNRLKLVVVV